METKSDQNPVHVVAAVIRAGDQILCARRAAHKDLPGLWEFPGGKVEYPESASGALARELHEELQLKVGIGPKFGETLTASGISEIYIEFFEVWIEAPIGLSSTDHDKLEWRTRAQLLELLWAPADIAIVQQLASGL